MASDLAWPAFIQGRGATLAAAVSGLQASDRWSADELREGQRRQLAFLVRQAMKQVPWYGAAERAAGFAALMASDAGRFWEAWAELPVLTKVELREHNARLNARAVPSSLQPLGLTRTSGSVGIPVEVQTTTVSRLAWGALTVREHLWRGRDFGKRLGVTRSLKRDARVPGGQDQASWGPPVAELHATGPSSVIHIGEPVPRIAEWLRRFDPHYLLTYPSVAAELLEHLGAGGRPPSLEEVRLMSEPVDAELDARLRGEWGVGVADVYSANEVGNIAFRCREGSLHVQSEAILVELLDDRSLPCATGESGRVVVTALHNVATPLIRYDIGDYATPGGPCACGRAHPVIERVLGRVRNLARTPDGRQFWPTALAKVREVKAVRQFQFVQVAPDTLELRVVLDRPLTVEEEQALGDIVRRLMRYPFQVRVSPVPAIERGPTGKFEEFRSELVL